MTSVLFKKRDQFHSQIRSQYLEDYMKKIRYEVLQQQSVNPKNCLNSFIEATQTKITSHQVKFLVDWANEKDQNNSIIHIGNLLIDGLINIDFLLENFQLRLKNSQYWPWLIRVIISLNQSQNNFTQNTQNYLNWQNKSLEYILGRLPSIQSSFCLTQCLQILTLKLEKQPQTTIHEMLTSHKGVVLKIAQNTLHCDKKNSELCYEILDTIIQFSDVVTQELVTICSLTDIQHIIIIGLNKIDTVQRKFPFIVCRMINNIYASKIVMSEEIMKSCINISLNKNNSDKVKVQLSFLWLSFFQICNSQIVLDALKEKVFHVFQFFLINPCKKQSNYKIIMENVGKSLKKIVQRAQQLDESTLMQINSKVDMLVRQYNFIQTSKEQNYKQNTVKFVKQQNKNIESGTFNKQLIESIQNSNITSNNFQMDLEES